MNIIMKKYLLLIIILSFLFLYNYAEESKNKNKKTEKKQVCLLYYKSKYKLALVNEIEKELKEKNINVVKDSINNMNNYNPDDYYAVVLFSGIKAFTPYPKATQYIKKHNYAHNIIYFCAASSVEDSVYGFLDPDRVDAVSSASEMNNIKDTADVIMKKILALKK